MAGCIAGIHCVDLQLIQRNLIIFKVLAHYTGHYLRFYIIRLAIIGPFLYRGALWTYGPVSMIRGHSTVVVAFI